MSVALIAGGSGLIGAQLLELLLASDRYHKIVAVTRKDLPYHEKLIQVKIEKDKLGEFDPTWQIDDVYCCLGTTMAKAHSKEKFYQVDFEYPVALGEKSLPLGATQYLLVSALGADKKSAIYYNRVKGDVEEAISTMGFRTVHIFRPSLLLGPRPEKRSAEEAAKIFYTIFGFIIPAKYKAIESEKIAKAMIHFASQHKPGTFIHESKALQKF